MQETFNERGTLAAFEIDKDTKRVETLADFHLYDNGQRVYTPANKPSADDIGAISKSLLPSNTGGYANIVGKLARVGSDGVMEVGQYIDFHTKGSTADYDVRLTCSDADTLNVEGGKFKVGGNEVLTSANLQNTAGAMKTLTINKPSGAVDGKYYPVVFENARHQQDVYISSRQSGAADPMNCCSFSGEVRAMGWSDGTSYAQGLFTIYLDGSERAIHSVWCNSESEGIFAFYVEARAFPLVVRVNATVNVKTAITNISSGTSVYPAGATSEALDNYGAFGTKIKNLQNFIRGTGFYRWDRAVNDQAITLKDAVNFDNYDKGGTYNLYNIRHADSVNPPPFDYGTLFVIGCGRTALTFVTQYATDKVSRKTYVRTRNDGSMVWTGWVQIYDSANKPTPADLGAVNKAGDTLTGTLTTKDIKVAAGSKLYLPTADSNIIQIYSRPSGDTFGGNLFITSGGNTVVGSGESATNLESLTNGENLYLTADGSINLISGGNAWADRKTAVIDPSGNFFLNKDQTVGRFYFGSTNTYVARSGNNLYLAANGDGGKVYIEGKANPIARVNGQDYTIYHTGNKPTADDIGALVGKTKTTVLRNTTDGQWQTLARVRMPQSASTSKFTIIGGSGFNVGSFGQATETTIIVRSGNDNPKGITVVVYNTGGTNPIIKAAAWKLVSGDDYDIFVQCGSYANAGIRADWIGAGSSLIAWGSDAPSSTKPTGVADARVITSYNNHYKPSPADVGAFNAGGPTATVSSGNVAWNAKSGVYTSQNSGDSDLIAHFLGSHSCPALQIKARYKNGGLWYRSARDGQGFEEGWDQIYTKKNKPTAADVGALPTSGGTISGDLRVGSGRLIMEGVNVIGAAADVVRFGDADLTRSLNLNAKNGEAYVQQSGGVKHRIYHEGYKQRELGVKDVRDAVRNPDYFAARSFSPWFNNTGMPSSVWYSGFTMRGWDGAYNVWQMFSNSATGASDNKLYFRTGNGSTWNPTYEVYHTGRKPSAGDIGAAPAGYGLGTYGKSISTVLGDCELRTKSGYFQGSGIQGIPTEGHTWKYIFSQAHGNAAGYFGYFAVDFAGSKAWVGAQEAGNNRVYELVKRGDSIFAGGRVEINTGVNPMLEWHMPGKHAVCAYVDANGNFRLGTSNGAGGEVALRFQAAANGELYVNGNGNFNDVYIRSDRRMKSDLVKVDNALEKVSKLTAYSYNKHKSITDSDVVAREVGLIAQDLKEVLPEAVNVAEDSTMTISNSAVNALLVEAIKELKAEIEMLKRGQGE